MEILAPSEQPETAILVSLDDSSSSSGEVTMETKTAEEQPETTQSALLMTSVEDPMLGFLTLLGQPSKPSCANCENKDQTPMYYCNTCCKYTHSNQ